MLQGNAAETHPDYFFLFFFDSIGTWNHRIRLERCRCAPKLSGASRVKNIEQNTWADQIPTARERTKPNSMTLRLISTDAAPRACVCRHHSSPVGPARSGRPALLFYFILYIYFWCGERRKMRHAA